MATPQVVTTDSVRDFLAGENLASWLSALPDADATLQRNIMAAQSDVERICKTHLTRRVIRCRPAGNKPDGTPYVKGTDYDYEEDAYHWFPDSWHGWAQMHLKKRPIQSVQGVRVRYGQSQVQNVLTFPDQWIVAEHRFGILNIVPIVGMGTAQATGLVLLPILGHGIMNRGMIPCIVSVDYTAGFLPPDFDPETDDPFDANPDQDCRGLLEAVRMLAAAKTLRRVQVHADSNAGSVSLDGLSESVSPGFFKNAVDDMETSARALMEEFQDDGPMSTAVI